MQTFTDIAAKDAPTVYTNFPLARLTRFRTGGCADRLIVPRESDAGVSLHRLDINPGVQITVIGGGSNILIRDGGIRGDTMIFRPENFGDIHFEEERHWSPTISAQAGAYSAKIAECGRAAGYAGTGLEFLAGIPGTIGGAVAGNAGCFGREIKDIPLLIQAYDLQTRSKTWLDNGMCGFGYRTSVFSSGRYIVENITLTITEEAICDPSPLDIDEILAQKRATQPISAKTAGSVFKNPTGDGALPAWKLIDMCGLRGHQIGMATSNDIENLIEHIREAVYERRSRGGGTRCACVLYRMSPAPE
jgi:UDP-N-acetylmuramate dehydrogenase